VAYFGWVSNHGYNANERLGDRDYVIKEMLKDQDDVRSVGRAFACSTAFLTPAFRPPSPTPPRSAYLQDAVFKMHRWGVRYVVAEYAPRHNRPSERAFQEAQAARGRGEDVQVPNFDPNVYLNGAITRVFNAGRFEVFRVN
jgi:hypothetical protein